MLGNFIDFFKKPIIQKKKQIQEVCNEKQMLNLKQLNGGWEIKHDLFPLSVTVVLMVEQFHIYVNVKAIFTSRFPLKSI